MAINDVHSVWLFGSPKASSISGNKYSTSSCQWRSVARNPARVINTGRHYTVSGYRQSIWPKMVSMHRWFVYSTNISSGEIVSPLASYFPTFLKSCSTLHNFSFVAEPYRWFARKRRDEFLSTVKLLRRRDSFNAMWLCVTWRNDCATLR